jgi:hypothetical protein
LSLLLKVVGRRDSLSLTTLVTNIALNDWTDNLDEGRWR